MSKKVKVLVSMVAAIILLTAGGTTVAMANEEEAVTVPREWMNSPFLARVAEILGISTDNLTGAVTQAWQEMREENLVQATGNVNMSLERGGEIEKGLLNRQRVQQKIRNRVLEKAMESGRIDEAEIGENEEWQESRPGALDRLVPHARIFKAMRSRQMIAVPEGWNGTLAPELAD